MILTSSPILLYVRLGSSGEPELGTAASRPWRIWDLDIELRYRPVVAALPKIEGEICEVGSGAAGLARWTNRSVVGIDPGANGSALPNLRVIQTSGADIPLPDESVAAAVAVDTLEHLSPALRPPVLREMNRVTRDGGRVIVSGPTGPAAAEGDLWLAARHAERGVQGESARWLADHLENGVPSIDEIVAALAGDRVEKISTRGVFNVAFWRLTHRVGLGLLPAGGPLHCVIWGPVAFAARRFHHGHCYRQLVVAEIGRSRAAQDLPRPTAADGVAARR